MVCDATDRLETAPAGVGMVTLGVFTSRIGDALGDVARGLKTLQDEFAPLITATAATPALAVGLQSLDRLEQTARDLATVVADLAAATPAAVADCEDLTRRCKLAEIAQRLRGHAAPPVGDDVDFF